MSDVDLVLGAKNKTEPAFSGVDRSLNRLQSRARTASQSMTKLANPKAMNNLANTTKRSVGRMSASFSKLKAAMGPLLAVFAAVKTVQKGIAAVGAANEAYDAQTEAVQGLSTALRVNGEEVEGNSARLQAFATDMQALTGVGDEVTLGLMKSASMLGVQSDSLDDAAKAAIGLSEATGKDLNTSLEMARKAMQGDFGSLNEVIPAMRQATSDTERLAMVSELAAKGLDAKAESANRLAGMTERAKGAMGDMMEQIGALLAPIRMLIAKGIKNLAETMTDLLVPAVDFVNRAFNSVRPIFNAVIEHVQRMFKVWGEVFSVMGGIVSDLFGKVMPAAGAKFAGIAEKITALSMFIAEKVISAVTMIEVVWNNFPAIIEVAVAKVQLSMETLRANVEHVLTRAIPAYAIWLGQNFTNILQDMASATLAIVTNLGQKLGDSFRIIFEFIKSGMEGGLSGLMSDLGDTMAGSLLEGFEAKTSALPDIAARAITARETQLSEQIGGIGRKLGDQFSTKFAERMAGLGEKMGTELATDVSLKLGTDAAGLAKGGSTSTLQATESRLMTRGASDDPMTMIAANSKTQVDELKGIRGELKAANDADQLNTSSPALQVEVVG